MDKETLSNYGWIVIAVLVLVVMIALAGPFGNFVSEAVQSTTKGLFDVNKNALDAADIPIDNQEFDVPNGNGGAGENGGSDETPVTPSEPEETTPTIITFTTQYDATDPYNYKGYEGTYSCTAKNGMTWGEWVNSEYNYSTFYVDMNKHIEDGECYEICLTNGVPVKADEQIIEGYIYILFYD